MESKIAGYKLVPEIEVILNCKGCYFDNQTKGCTILDNNQDCLKYKAIYVPADTAIEVPKVNKPDNKQ